MPIVFLEKEETWKIYLNNKLFSDDRDQILMRTIYYRPIM